MIAPLPTPVIFLLGPTASGKTATALTLADRFNVELISVDSALVFRDMNIGTAKPDAATLQRYPHHLVNVIDPTEAYSAARFCVEANALISDIHARGRVPLLVGGTMLYVKALREGLSAMPAADASVRAAIAARADAAGWPTLHAELSKVDAVTAARLAPNDSQRISRALEVYALTGVPISALQTRDDAVSPFAYTSLMLGLCPTARAVLHTRIAARFDAMLAAGLLEEVTALKRTYALNADLPSMRCVGYRQAWEYLEGLIDKATLRESGIIATRQLAKRQLTWLRSTPDLENFDCLRATLADDIAFRVAQFLAAHGSEF